MAKRDGEKPGEFIGNRVGRRRKQVPKCKVIHFVEIGFLSLTATAGIS